MNVGDYEKPANDVELYRCLCLNTAASMAVAFLAKFQQDVDYASPPQSKSDANTERIGLKKTIEGARARGVC